MNLIVAKIYKTNAPYVVRTTGGIIAETRGALALALEGQNDVIFFPIEDIALPLFDPSETTHTDKQLGKAKYYHLAGKSGQIDDVAWQYIEPSDEFAKLKDYMTFDANKVNITSF